MHNEALTPVALRHAPSRKVTPARALAIVSPDPQDRGAADDTARARATPEGRNLDGSARNGEAGIAGGLASDLARTRVRTSALFLTQLIACSRRLPAYRERRRAAPQEAARAYDMAAAPGRHPARIVSES
jgi:hypothetical protein